MELPIDHIQRNPERKEIQERLAQLASRQAELRGQLPALQKEEREYTENRKLSTAEHLAKYGELPPAAPPSLMPIHSELREIAKATEILTAELERLDNRLSVEACNQCFEHHRLAVLAMRDTLIQYSAAVRKMRSIEDQIERNGYCIHAPIVRFFPAGSKPGENFGWLDQELQHNGYTTQEIQE